jgi:hypothetical protein
VAVLVAACGSGTEPDCPKGQVWGSGGLFSEGSCGVPATECRSWAIWVAPGWAGGNEPNLVFDRSVSPARTDLKAGALLKVGLESGRFEPAGCGTEVRYQQFSFRSSDPAVLRFVQASGGYTALFLAVAPGSARVFADGPTPDGRSAELSICIDPSTRADKECARAPLVVQVVP